MTVVPAPRLRGPNLSSFPRKRESSVVQAKTLGPRLREDDGSASQPPVLSRADLAEYLPLLAKGALITVEVFVFALAVATVLGMVWALMRVSGVYALTQF